MSRFPTFKAPRKLIIAAMGMFALLGGGGAAAFYVGTEAVLGKDKSAGAGAPCITVTTMLSKAQDGHLWLRKYVRTAEAVTGEDRLKTALRVAALAAKVNIVDLVQINVLAPNGPTKRAEMRGQAIGAHATIGLRMEHLPDLKKRVVAAYVDGSAGVDGEFHGDRVTPDYEELATLVQAMKEAIKEDCREIAAES